MDQTTPASNKHQLRVSAQLEDSPMMTFARMNQPPGNGSVGIVVPLNVLAESQDYQEYWFDHSPVVIEPTGNNSLLKVVQTDQHLVLSYQADALSFSDVVEQIYQDAYTMSLGQGFPHLIRAWNFIDRINDIEEGMERYQTFCVARHQVLEQLDLLQANNPAATAIGGHHGHNVFIFLFSKNPGQVVENKRQVSAWQYPKLYSPKQPRFSRAMRCGSLLMCSGTASVVGHETIHLNDLAAQFEECLTNVQALLEEAAMKTPLNSGLFRFYLRDKTLLNQVIKLIEVRNIQSYIILEGDICRENLLIECEAVFQ